MPSSFRSSSAHIAFRHPYRLSLLTASLSTRRLASTRPALTLPASTLPRAYSHAILDLFVPCFSHDIGSMLPIAFSCTLQKASVPSSNRPSNAFSALTFLLVSCSSLCSENRFMNRIGCTKSIPLESVPILKADVARLIVLGF